MNLRMDRVIDIGLPLSKLGPNIYNTSNEITNKIPFHILNRIRQNLTNFKR